MVDKENLLLDRIEEQEMRSLQWGFLDGFLTETEIDKIITGIGFSDYSDPLEDLIEKKLIIETTYSGSKIGYRSRFAESVRLLVKNRQLFPNKNWRISPSLVSDFRVDRRPRFFPKRDIEPQEVKNQLNLSSTFSQELWDAFLLTLKVEGFAGFQVKAFQRLLQKKGDFGTIITSGTGSGKTISFYLPSLIKVAEVLTKKKWVKVLSIYPRVELLKDQFTETFRFVRGLRKILVEAGRRPITLGTFYNATPFIGSEKYVSDNWERKGKGYVCPWLQCLDCGGEMIWSLELINKKVECLECSNSNCAFQTYEDELVLTRGKLQNNPTDFLFTTTETLNRRISDTWSCHLFGLGTDESTKPMFILLDEVHTYDGASGANAALTFRRWKQLVHKEVNWVGLSATLNDAVSFFSNLTGLDQGNVSEITPEIDELEEKGAEYQLILRGNPATKTSLLSTTIQSAMLLPRLLEVPGGEKSTDLYGEKAFVFTDDLDAINRLYYDLLDAEAYNIYAEPDTARFPLAKLRQNSKVADKQKYIEGQRWKICENIGHSLDNRLKVGRTTSQDTGVTKDSNVIVATSSLEVGFNDTTVGAVIQHKAPRGMASFLQRKGRAGRDRKMRPITLTILSDYGRDRSFYQSFEFLFDPILESHSLPIKNSYILKIQGTYALMDWISINLSQFNKIWMWDIISQPAIEVTESKRKSIEEVKQLVTKLLHLEDEIVSNLRLHLKNSLQITDSEVDNILWETPRSLLLEVVPTLFRRIFRNWQLVFPSVNQKFDNFKKWHPLPEFIPSSLFGDLGLPEVTLEIPPATIKHASREESMPILQALNQFPPGRVSRRFAFERGALSHWSPLNELENGIQEIDIRTYAAELEYLGEFVPTANIPNSSESIKVFRPWKINLNKVDKVNGLEILPSSNSRHRWLSNIMSNGEELNVPVPTQKSWTKYIKEVKFFLHRFGSGVIVQRFSHTVDSTTLTRSKEYLNEINFTNEGEEKAGVGFELDVDGLRVDLSLREINKNIFEMIPKNILRSLKTQYIKTKFTNSKKLPKDLNIFQREWLLQILVCHLILSCEKDNQPLEETLRKMSNAEDIGIVFSEVIESTFDDLELVLSTEEEIANHDEEEKFKKSFDKTSSSKLKEALSSQIKRKEIFDSLCQLSKEFVSPNENEFQTWVEDLITNTFAESILQGCLNSSPKHITGDNILVDIEKKSNHMVSIWVTETSLGGAGVLEAFASKFAEEPIAFFKSIEASIAASDLELVDNSLREILALIEDDEEIRDKVSSLRANNSHSEREKKWELLKQALVRKSGVDLSHSLSVSFSNRLLREGSGPKFDELLLLLTSSWSSLEEKYNFSISLREFAFVASKINALYEPVTNFLEGIINSNEINPQVIRTNIENLLWAPASEIRQKSLQSYNPFRENKPTDPGVIRLLFENDNVFKVEVSDNDWVSELNEGLIKHGMVQLGFNKTHRNSVRKKLISIIVDPIGIGSLQLYPKLENLEKKEDKFLLTVSLREQI